MRLLFATQRVTSNYCFWGELKKKCFKLKKFLNKLEEGKKNKVYDIALRGHTMDFNLGLEVKKVS